MNLYTAVQKSSGLRDVRNIHVRLMDTRTHNMYDAIIGSAVFIEDISISDNELARIYRVKFEVGMYVISTIITFGLIDNNALTHNIRDEDEEYKSYIAFI